MASNMVSLFSLANWKNGLAFKQINFSEKGKPVIKIAELKNGITAQTARTQQEFDSDVHLTKGDMVFSWSGNPETSIDVFWYDLPDGWLNQHIFKVTPNNGVDKLYLYYLLKFLKPQFTAIASNKQTTGLGHVTVKDMKEMMVPLPEMAVQQAIGAYLHAIDQKAYVNNKINDNLQQQAYAYFLRLFVENEDPSWHVGTIADIGTVVGGGTPSKTKPEYYTEDGIAWITPKDLSIDKSKFIAHGENDISELGYRNSSATMMPAGTVLFSSRAPIGYIAIASNEVTTNQGFKSVVPHPEIGTPFVYYFLIHNLPLIESKASGSTFKEVSGSVMKSVEAVIPDGDTLAKFNDFCRPIFAMQEKLEQENRKLAEMRDSLLPLLMNGEIDVADIDA